MAFKRHFLVMIWMAFSVLSLSAKKEWNADNVPIPFLQDSTQYVSDPDGYVDRALKDSANFYLQKLKLECGVQNVLIIVGRVADQDAFRMAQDVGNKYGIGYKKSRRGLGTGCYPVPSLFRNPDLLPRPLHSGAGGSG